MSFPRYPSYKESRIDWMGQVPEHWSVLSLGKVTVSRCDGPFGSGLKSDHYTESGVRVIRLQNLRSTGFDGTDAVFISTDYYARELCGHDVIPGDVLIAGLGDDRNTVGRACVAPGDLGEAMVKADCFRFRLETRRALPGFVALQLCVSAPFDAAILSTGSTRSRIPLTTMSSRALALPPLAEQYAIELFIQKRTREIDALIAEQQRLIELLKEKGRAVITHAVTKGLNPNAPLRASGNSWIGAIPAHWHYTRIKWVAAMESGHTPDKKKPEYWDGDIPWVSLNDTGFLRDHEVIADTAHSVTELGVANSSARILPQGAVVFSRDATIGRCAITARPMTVSQHFIAWICRPDLLPEYLLFRFRSMTPELERLTTGATVKTIGMPDVRTLETPVPPLPEQRAIVEWIAKDTFAVDGLLREAERAIELLLERRTALISAAVTGQIDVRGLVDMEAA